MNTRLRFVQDIMTTNVKTVTPQMGLHVALKEMLTNRVKRLPVVQENDNDNERRTVVGIVTDRNLRLAADSPFLGESKDEFMEHLKQHKVEDIMTKTVVTVEDTAPIVEAAKLMRVSNVGGLPVVNGNGNLVGICSTTDLVDHLIRILEPLNESSSEVKDQEK